MKIINLVEDTKGGVCLNEHGLSFYIETKKHKLLVDSGATDMFLHNADVLGVDLTQVDTFILSHGHYDHAGGLTAFAKINPNAKIYLKDSVGGDYYHLSDKSEKYIGIDKTILELPQIIKVQENVQIDDELFLFSNFKEKRYPAWSNQELKQKVGNTYIQDDFAHEQCLVISQGEHRTLMSGCAHNGILSILDGYFELFGTYPDMVISGFHMVKKSDYTEEEVDSIRQTARELMKTKSLFYTGHCTGQKAFAIMKEMMGEQLQGFHSGSKLGVLKVNEFEIIELLKDKDDKKAYEFAKEIGAKSAESNEYYALFDSFIDMLEEKSSYVRTRGFILACAQARWDNEGKISAALDRMCTLLNDEKPTVVRQCLSALHEVVLYRPELADRICKAVKNIDLSCYKDSMAPLIKKDAEQLLEMLE